MKILSPFLLFTFSLLCQPLPALDPPPPMKIARWDGYYIDENGQRVPGPWGPVITVSAFQPAGRAMVFEYAYEASSSNWTRFSYSAAPLQARWVDAAYNWERALGAPRLFFRTRLLH